MHYKTGNSVRTTQAVVFAGTGPDTLIVDAGAFIIAEGSGGATAELNATWTATINGAVEDFGSGGLGLWFEPSAPPNHASITVGAAGDVYGTAEGLVVDENATINNKGAIYGTDQGLELGNGGAFTLTNSGTIQSDIEAVTAFNAASLHLTNTGKLIGTIEAVFGSAGDDFFTDFKASNGVTKSGTVVGVINLEAGHNIFNGGAHAETVQDGGGTDSVKLGGANDIYLGATTATTAGNATIDGGAGTDTYDASGASSTVFINLDKVSHGILLPAQSAAGPDIGNDHLSGFENATGGSGNDDLSGSSTANTLSGGAGKDVLVGLAGRDVLTGGAGADVFDFTRLSDSTVKASGRDLIMDFSHADGDQIDLSLIDANTKLANDQAFSFIGTAVFSHQAGQLRESYSGGNTILSGDVNGDGKADFAIALHSHLLLQANDFNL